MSKNYRIIVGVAEAGNRVHGYSLPDELGNSHYIVSCSGRPIPPGVRWNPVFLREDEPPGLLEQLVTSPSIGCTNCQKGLRTGRLLWQKDSPYYWLQFGLEMDAAEVAVSLWREWDSSTSELVKAVHLLGE